LSVEPTAPAPAVQSFESAPVYRASRRSTGRSYYYSKTGQSQW
jgi:hypothetical protein